MQTLSPYTLADLLCWIEAVRIEFTKDHLVNRLPYDRHFIAGVAQGLPEVQWCIASARVAKRASVVDGAAAQPTLLRASLRQVCLVAFDGQLLCPRGQPDTLVERVLQHAMATTVKELGGRWDAEQYRLTHVHLQQLDRNAKFDGVFAPGGLTAPSTQVAELLQGYRARHLAAQALEHATPSTIALAPVRRI